MKLEDIKEIEYDLINKQMIIILKHRVYHHKRMIDKMAFKCDYETFISKCEKWLNSLKIN